MFRELRTGIRGPLGHLFVARSQRPDSSSAGPHHAQPHVRSTDVKLHRVASGGGLRNPRRKRRHRTTRPVSLVAPGGPPEHQRIKQKRSGPESASDRLFSQRQLSGPVQHSRDAQVHQKLARQAPGDVARGPLPGGGKASRPCSGTRRQVQSEKKVSVAQNDLGRRAKNPLFQRTDEKSSPRVVPPRPLS